MMKCGCCGGQIEVGETYVIRGDGDIWSAECFEELGEAYIEKYDDYAYKKYEGE